MCVCVCDCVHFLAAVVCIFFVSHQGGDMKGKGSVVGRGIRNEMILI